MKYLLMAALILMPFESHSHLLTGRKWEMIEESNKHRILAKNCLLEADRLCFYIPDLSKRELFKTLIISSIASLTAPGPKLKLLTVGLSLIGSMAADAYDTYERGKKLLVDAAYHMEIANFYENISFQFNDCNCNDLGTQSFLSAIDNLTMCDMLTCCIDDHYTKINASAQIRELRDILIRQFTNPAGFLGEDILDEAQGFYENAGEILAEIEDFKIYEEIMGYVGAMVDDIEAAYQHWGQKRHILKIKSYHLDYDLIMKNKSENFNE
jgi:hypothetical protein